MIKYSIDPKIKIKKIEEFVEVPHIVLVNKFDENSAKEFRNEFSKALNTGQPIIPVIIDSYGGHCYSLMSMIDIIKASPVPVATIVTGKAMSCGAVLFSCGAENHRYIAPTATVMIHTVSSGMWGKLEEIKSDVREAERLNDLIFKLMANNVGKADDYFLKLVDEHKQADWFLNAEECKKHNLANHIRVPNFKVAIKTEILFE